MNTKRCSKCKTVKPVDEFYKYRQSKDGYNWWCKRCYRPKSASPKANGPRGRPCLPPNGFFPNDFLHTLYNNIRRGSLARHREFNLDSTFLRGLLIEFCTKNYFSIAPRHPFRPSCDRIDNARGYTKDNVRICWLIENYAKNVFTDEQVIEFCKRKLGISTID
jgi:hypothetical protein